MILRSIRLFAGILFILRNPVSGQTQVFDSLPEWESTPLSHVTTGLGIADINQDGWDDIIVANGNDILRQSVCVYYNNGDGTFPHSPSWNSGDIDFHGHLAVGDVNGDGLPDVAVSVFLGPGEFYEPGGVKIYFNQGTELESKPSYRTADSTFSFSCALGDADGDGDLDLAVAGGQPYALGLGPYRTYGRIYYNLGDSLQRRPGWKSAITMAALDVEFADIDRNGYLDLAFANHLTPNYIFFADRRGEIQHLPGWTSLDDDRHGNSVALATLDDNACPDVIISDNDQLGGLGRFKAYFFDSTAIGKTTPNWYSNTGGYGSAVIAEDLNGDGYSDLLAGRWWGQIELYPGIPGGLDANPAWSSGTRSVIEAFALRDLDQDNRYLTRDIIDIKDDSIHVIYLKKSNVEKITSVIHNEQILIAGMDYCSVPSAPWLSLKNPLRRGDRLEIAYLASDDRDLVVSNWDQNTGNYLFYNQNQPNAVAIRRIDKYESYIVVYPNPMNQGCQFSIVLPAGEAVNLSVYNMLGERVRSFDFISTYSGTHRLTWDGTSSQGIPVSSEVFIYRLRMGGKMLTGKLVVIR